MKSGAQADTTHIMEVLQLDDNTSIPSIVSLLCEYRARPDAACIKIVEDKLNDIQMEYLRSIKMHNAQNSFEEKAV